MAALIRLDQVLVATEPVDMRVGADGLPIRVQAMLARLPFGDSAYALRNKRCMLVKLLIWDSNGVRLRIRRLHRSSFVWPAPGVAHCPLSVAQRQWLPNGIDWQRMMAQPPAELRV